MPVDLSMKIPRKIVRTDPKVVINTMFAAMSESLSMAFAMIKLLTAVGEAKSTNRTPRSAPRNPNRYADSVKIMGLATIFTNDAARLSEKFLLMLPKLKEPPIPSSARGMAREER